MRKNTVVKKWCWTIAIDYGELNEEYSQGTLKVNAEDWKAFCDARFKYEVAKNKMLGNFQTPQKDQNLITEHRWSDRPLTVHKGKLKEVKE